MNRNTIIVSCPRIINRCRLSSFTPEIYLTILINVTNTIGLDYSVHESSASARKIKWSRLEHDVQEIELATATGEHDSCETINPHWLEFAPWHILYDTSVRKYDHLFYHDRCDYYHSCWLNENNCSNERSF